MPYILSNEIYEAMQNLIAVSRKFLIGSASGYQYATNQGSTYTDPTYEIEKWYCDGPPPWPTVDIEVHMNLYLIYNTVWLDPKGSLHTFTMDPNGQSSNPISYEISGSVWNGEINGQTISFEKEGEEPIKVTLNIQLENEYSESHSTIEEPLAVPLSPDFLKTYEISIVPNPLRYKFSKYKNQSWSAKSGWIETYSGRSGFWINSLGVNFPITAQNGSGFNVSQEWLDSNMVYKVNGVEQTINANYFGIYLSYSWNIKNGSGNGTGMYQYPEAGAFQYKRKKIISPGTTWIDAQMEVPRYRTPSMWEKEPISSIWTYNTLENQWDDDQCRVYANDYGEGSQPTSAWGNNDDPPNTPMTYDLSPHFEVCRNGHLLVANPFGGYLYSYNDYNYISAIHAPIVLQQMRDYLKWIITKRNIFSSNGQQITSFEFLEDPLTTEMFVKQSHLAEINAAIAVLKESYTNDSNPIGR